MAGSLRSCSPSPGSTRPSLRPLLRLVSPRSFLSARPLSPSSVSYLGSHVQFGRLPSRRGFSAVASVPVSADGTSPVLIVEDDKYARKRVIRLTPALYSYLMANVREQPILRELREETATMHGSQMQVSPDEAQLLSMLVQILGAQQCIEVGVYTGYSSLAIALILPESGRLVACEKDARCLEIAKKYYERAGVSHKVDVRHGDAADTLRAMIQNGESCSYDFAFLDANKRAYDQYFEMLLELVKVGGVIVIDNVLWQGRVADPLVDDPKTVSIRDFNSKILRDSRVNISMVPIGDGITMCRKIWS
ncbi:unnamed protein product [Spirodela intermedia]|uniref:Uncharacterized protein n=1 Tax=Spirodela intermedia TaxID=51605 RepID=A0A7I8LMB1_SPIIN|nr:unnamed protein product [Spirodela intermedia]